MNQSGDANSCPHCNVLEQQVAELKKVIVQLELRNAQLQQRNRALIARARSFQAKLQREQSLHLAGAAAALRQRLGVPLTPTEQPRLERALEFARRTLGNAAGLTAWMEGWAMPVEQAIQEALNCDAESGRQTRNSP